ncbi:cytochrome P450 [Lentinus tigrinus ALCF2SS1-7]|uniref:Cytochrome P450 n=1 Tax=Lentinus tigrinus ALCF2SS1-6 TaxID=1328759 RepID=A0A5C2RNQ0_9APHY|nr:cytochrome P450 [Lentinus tigrinus ALCF2SS1-6]RPD75366.1 cytochrome P450 [Lentinus tigrinus ALCF2SS1-7]
MATTMISSSLIALGVLVLLSILPPVRRKIKQRSLQNVPGPASPSFITGIATEFHSPFDMRFREHVLTSYGRVLTILMPLGDVAVAISDPVALAAMLGRYRDVFELPAWFSDTLNAVWGPGLMSVQGKEHSQQRRLLNPAFAVRHLRDMVPTFSGVSRELVAVLRKEVREARTELDISQFLSRFTLESIGRTGLGYTFGALDNHGTDYSRALKEFGPAMMKLHHWRLYLPWVRRIFPRSWLRWATEVLPWPALRHMRGISDSVYMASLEVLQRKRELLKHGRDSLSNEVGEGKDLVSILLRLDTSVSDENLIGHMLLLTLGATDTTSSMISRVIELLARHPEVQAKLREELEGVTSGSSRSLADLDYEAYAALPHLEAVIRETLIRETLRMYPPLQISPRVAYMDAVLPLGQVTGADGRTIDKLFVPEGTIVWINMFGLNRDKDIWGPDADEWKPERWLKPLPPSVADAHIPSIYANTASFLAGPRACIGYNMALTVMRIAITHLVLFFNFAPSEKEIVWMNGGVVSPTVKGATSLKPELPVVMTALY